VVPREEADTYEKYANDHAQSPAAPQALYERCLAAAPPLIEIFKTELNQEKAEETKKIVLSLWRKNSEPSTPRVIGPCAAQPPDLFLHPARDPHLRKRNRIETEKDLLPFSAFSAEFLSFRPIKCYH